METIATVGMYLGTGAAIVFGALCMIAWAMDWRQIVSRLCTIGCTASGVCLIASAGAEMMATGTTMMLMFRATVGITLLGIGIGLRPQESRPADESKDWSEEDTRRARQEIDACFSQRRDDERLIAQTEDMVVIGIGQDATIDGSEERAWGAMQRTACYVDASEVVHVRRFGYRIESAEEMWCTVFYGTARGADRDRHSYPIMRTWTHEEEGERLETPWIGTWGNPLMRCLELAMAGLTERRGRDEVLENVRIEVRVERRPSLGARHRVKMSAVLAGTQAHQ